MWCTEPRKRFPIVLTKIDWCAEVVTINHTALGSVTDGIFRIGYCMKKGRERLKLRERGKVLKGTLLEI